ncbi:MAG: sortase [Acidimicrobiia bacterium]
MHDHGRHGRPRRGAVHRHHVTLFVALAVVAFVAGQLWWTRSATAGSRDLQLSGDPQREVPAPPSTTAAGRLDEGRSLLDALPVSPTTSTTAAPTTTAAAMAPTTTSPLPTPDLLPDDPYADTPEVVVGRISIPAIGLDEDLQQGMTLTAINRGPSHWPGTASPGELGNAVIAGHRTTYSKPFRNLDLLQPGDAVVYSTDRGTFTYSVTGTEIVTPEEVRIADQTAAYTSTLFACHPPGSAAYRIVVHLQLLDEVGQPVPPLGIDYPPVTVPR